MTHPISTNILSRVVVHRRVQSCTHPLPSHKSTRYASCMATERDKTRNKASIDPNLVLVGGVIFAGLVLKDRDRRDKIKTIAKSAIDSTVRVFEGSTSKRLTSKRVESPKEPDDPLFAALIEQAKKRSNDSPVNAPKDERKPIKGPFVVEQRADVADEPKDEGSNTASTPRKNAQGARQCVVDKLARIPSAEIACDQIKDVCASVGVLMAKRCKQRAPCDSKATRSVGFVPWHVARFAPRRARAPCDSKAKRSVGFVPWHVVRFAPRLARAPCAFQATQSVGFVPWSVARFSPRRARALCAFKATRNAQIRV